MIQFSNCLAAVVIDALSPPLPLPPPLASDKTFGNGKEEKEEDDDEEEVGRRWLALLPLMTISHFRSTLLVSVLIVGLAYGARNVIPYTYTGCMMQHFLAFRDSPIIPLRRSRFDLREAAPAVLPSMHN